MGMVSYKCAISWVSIALFSGVFGCGLQFAQSNSLMNDDIAALDSARSSKRLDLFEMVVQRGSETWRKRGRTLFLEFMSAACSDLSSYDFGDESEQTALLNRLAVEVLSEAGLSIREQAEFTGFLARDPLGIDDHAWSVLREKKARLWLTAWRRMSMETDSKFDFDNLPMVNLPAPGRTGLPAGVAPQAIKDARLRAEYEAAIARNAAYTRRYADQYWLRQHSQAFFTSAERYLINAYSRAPSATQELEQLLRQYINDGAVADRILSAVRNQKQH